MGDLVAMLQRLRPVYQDEIQKQFSSEWPNIKQTLTTEAKLLATNVREKGEASVREKMATAMKRQEDKIWTEFATLKDEQTRTLVIENLQAALEGATVGLLDERISKAQEKLLDAHEKILQFLPEDSRATFQERMSQVWHNFLLFNMGGIKQVETAPEADPEQPAGA